jgi:hypothetical protein
MTDLHKAAQQALWALQYHVEMTWPIDRTSEAIFNLRAALAQQQAGSWQDGVLEGHLRERERWLAQEQAEPKGGGRLPPPLPDIELLDDIELLELAAKAADIYDALLETEDGFVFIGSYNIWNPLADDGDALRLAVRLRSYGVHYFSCFGGASCKR